MGLLYSSLKIKDQVPLQLLRQLQYRIFSNKRPGIYLRGGGSQKGESFGFQVC